MNEYIYDCFNYELYFDDINIISKTRADRLLGKLYTLIDIAREFRLPCLSSLQDRYDEVLTVYDYRFSRSRCKR